MKTEQEQIEQIEKVLKNSVADYKHLKKKGVCYCYAETLIAHGYGNVSEYKAERELLGSKIKVLEQRLNNKYIEIDNLNRDYHNSFERLKAQEREIEKLKEEKKQAKIDVLNEAKEKLDSAPNGWAYTGYIDDLIEEVENGRETN